MLLDQEQVKEHIAALSDAALGDELMYHMELLELMSEGLDNNVEKPFTSGQNWTLSKTINYYNSLVFEMNQRFEQARMEASYSEK